MKTIFKFSFGLGALLLPLFANADVTFMDKYVPRDVSVMAPEFCFDNKPQLVDYEWDYKTDIITYTVFNRKFDEIAKLSFSSYPLRVSITRISDNTEYYGGITQTLFNTDSDYEWLVQNFEVIGGRNICTGIHVESQSGVTVAEIKAPEGYYMNDVADVYFSDEGVFLVLNMWTYEYEGGDPRHQDLYALYEINAKESSVKMVGAPRRVSVDPTTPRQGTLVNVDLGNPVTEACKVVVTSTSGKTVMTQSLEPGSMGTTIDTARLERGMYIVTVTDGKTTHENTKIIIR